VVEVLREELSEEMEEGIVWMYGRFYETFEYLSETDFEVSTRRQREQSLVIPTQWSNAQRHELVTKRISRRGD
jgi:hypothetical protein